MQPVFVLTSCVVLLTACATGPKTPTPTKLPPVEELPDASLIFLGTVKGNEEGGTARVVVVDQIYYQQGTFGDQTTKPVLVEGSTEAPGSQHVFYVDPVQFGKQVRVVQIGVRPAKRYSKNEIAQLVRLKRKQTLRTRIRGVELVFVGTVATVQPARVSAPGESEHDPLWVRATASVRETLRGRPSSARQDFLFASSDDVQWYRAPKPKQGLEALFLLRRGFAGATPEVAEALVLVREGDLIEGKDIELVREIFSEGDTQ